MDFSSTGSNFLGEEMAAAFWCGDCHDISGAPGSPLCKLCGVGTSRRKEFFRKRPRSSGGGSKVKKDLAPRPVDYVEEISKPKLLEG